MERMRRTVPMVVAIVAAAVVLVALLPGYDIAPPPNCSLEFRLQPLNTTSGWLYVVEELEGGAKPLSAYNVTAFTYVPGAAGGTDRVVDYEGPLTGLADAPGNLTFQDRGAIPGALDDAGDYFWASTWHVFELDRAGHVVAGTVGCV